MTTFQIPEGKVVDRIELDAGEGKATIDIIYKEDKPEEKKRVVVLCETNEPTGIYLSNLTGELVVWGRDDKPDPSYYVPMKKAEAGEFVVLPSKVCEETVNKLLASAEGIESSLAGSILFSTDKVIEFRRNFQYLQEAIEVLNKSREKV